MEGSGGISRLNDAVELLAADLGAEFGEQRRNISDREGQSVKKTLMVEDIRPLVEAWIALHDAQRAAGK